MGETLFKKPEEGKSSQITAAEYPDASGSISWLSLFTVGLFIIGHILTSRSYVECLQSN